MKKFPFGDVPEGTFFLTLVSIAGEIILSPVTAMTFVFLGREPEKWSIIVRSIKNHLHSGVEVIFILFRKRLHFAPFRKHRVIRPFFS